MPLVLQNQAPATVTKPGVGYSTLFPNADGEWGSMAADGVFKKLGAQSFGHPNLDRIRRIIPFGDSITANNSVYVNGAYQASNGFAENAIRKAARFTYLKNAGVGGNTVKQMRDRLAADILAAGPDSVMFMGGTNSILTGMSFADMAGVLNDYEYIIQQCLLNGIVPILLTPPAKTQAGVGADNTGWKETRDFIPFLYDLAAYYSVPLIDIFKFTCDTTTGGFRAGLSDDGVHPNQVGHARIADYVQFYLRNPHLAVNQVYLAAANEVNESGRLHNILQNGCFDYKIANGSMGGWGDASVGDNATVLVPSGADTALARSSGKLFKYTAAAGGTYFGNGLDPASFASGDVLEFSGRVTSPVVADANLGTDGYGLSVYLDIQKSDGSDGAMAMAINGDKNCQDVIFSMEVVVPPNKGDVTASIYLMGAGAYSFNNFTVTNKTVRQSYWKPGTLQA
jgi:lysophospholipase L1-like esterase